MFHNFLSAISSFDQRYMHFLLIGQDAVTVVGYPLGGDTISVTKGVVSRIEV